MKFHIDDTVFEQFPQYKVAVIIAKNVNQSNHLTDEAWMREAVKKAKEFPATHPNVASWIEVFKTAGFEPAIKPSHVALLERDSLPEILPIVDFFNHISVQYGIPIGAHDLANLTDDIVVRPTKSTDRFVLRGSQTQEEVETGKIAYTSGNLVLTKNWIWRQGQTSAVTNKSDTMFIPIDQLDNIDDQTLAQTTQEIAQRLEQQFGAQTQIFFVSKSNPTCEWSEANVFSKEDQQLRELLTRGVAQILPARDSLASILKTNKITLYLGIDPTGNQLHLGHAVVLRKLNQFAQAGHHVILLIGNGTVRIGDPTGRDSSRPQLTDESIRANFETWKEQASKILDFSKIEIRFNGDWLDKLSYTDLVKLMAQTTVQQLIERDMFQERLKKNLPIFGHEIMYPLLQGYDSVAMNVDLELGGTDQTFNMMMGRHLQKVYNDHEKWVLTTPIINGTDGRKMSKSFGNFVSLTDDPINMFGKIMSITDDLIITYFTLLTDVPMENVQALKEELARGKNPMEAKKLLAFTITSNLHSGEAAQQAQEHFETTVQKGEVVDAIPVHCTKGSFLIDLIKEVQPNSSKNDIRRLIEQGGVTLNGIKRTDPQAIIEQKGVLKVGKRNFYQIIL